MVPACAPTLAELVDVSDGVQVSAHPTRPDALVLSGVAPLEVSVARPSRTPRSTLCVTLDIDGQRVERERLRYLGREYGAAEELRLALTSTAWNDPRLYDRPGIGLQADEGVWIELLDPRPLAQRAEGPDARGAAIINILGKSE
jgi:hypothetical protein